MSTKIMTYWETFLQATKRDYDTKYYAVFSFGNTEELATECLELVLSGTKTATSSALPAYINNNEAQPRKNDLSIVTDWAGAPQCVIETTAVTEIKFSDMTYAICKREGEHDDLLSWQRDHRTFFIADGARSGYEFTEDMPILFEDFKVIYK